ncbi:hypothetical protein HOT31_gp129 [Microbacterium phage Hendrix]|uniref:Uncharacterized protein n=1 Tax=Microbacterium phage Hendrix TaxID=2182341 RepID=A0A2U8UUK5_9CAUD|nr:hypothetical protein HOT31_gp129 [Microbacterium phage Hendrix]AWN07799.1 hypothetical protein PBI_HENDRIX_128 [Microbacterium phage Hendrix]
MTSSSRPLEIRLREFLEQGRRTSAQIIVICDQMEERFPGEAQTTELRATARVQEILAGDLEKLLNGEELAGWKIEGVIPDGR